MNTPCPTPKTIPAPPEMLRAEVRHALADLPPQVAMQLQAMQARARQAVLQNSEWLTTAEICRRGAEFAGDSIEPERWRDGRQIFALQLHHQDLYPRYSLDDTYRPRPIMHSLLTTFASTDPWRIAVWFESANAWLQEERPRSRLCVDRISVLRALQYYNHGAHG